MDAEGYKPDNLFSIGLSPISNNYVTNSFTDKILNDIGNCSLVTLVAQLNHRDSIDCGDYKISLHSVNVGFRHLVSLAKEMLAYYSASGEKMMQRIINAPKIWESGNQAVSGKYNELLYDIKSIHQEMNARVIEFSNQTLPDVVIISVTNFDSKMSPVVFVKVSTPQVVHELFFLTPSGLTESISATSPVIDLFK